MRTWRITASELFRQWRIARDQRRQAKFARDDQRAAEELDRVRQGVDRFPPGGI